MNERAWFFGPARRGLAIALAFTLGASSAIGAAGCSHKDDDGTAPKAIDEKLPALTIRDDTPNLMLTWVDEKGDSHVELHPADVPAAGKELVRVVVTDREDGTRELFYVADLTKKRDDGSYPAQTMPRRAWETMIAKRREALLAQVTPTPALPESGAPGSPSGSPAPPSTGSPNTAGLTAIIYGASWCGPCHEAADYLKSRGIGVIMKDVDESPAAQSEMREKLAKVGQHGGSIPVIDVRGQILVGFSRGSIDRAIARATAGTVL